MSSTSPPPAAISNVEPMPPEGAPGFDTAA